MATKLVLCSELGASVTKAPAHGAGPALARRPPRAALFRAWVNEADVCIEPRVTAAAEGLNVCYSKLAETPLFG